MPNAVVTTEFLKETLDELLAGALATSKVILFTNSVTLTPDTVKADLTQPTFTGYAEIALAWNDYYIDDDGNLVIESQLLFYQPSAGTGLPQTIMGYGVTGLIAAAQHLIDAQYLDAPFVFQEVTDALAFVVRLKIPQTTAWASYRAVTPP